MQKEERKYDLIKFEDGEFSLDVRVEPNDDTVWLTQDEIAQLFGVNVPAISKHISNILNDGELNTSTISVLEKVQVEGNRVIKRNVKYFNLDMIISVGYRINSKIAVKFRQWANSILKEFLLKGHVINEERCLSCSTNLISLENKYNALESRMNNAEEIIFGKNAEIIFEGEIFEPYTLIRKLFFLAKQELIIIDNYADDFLLTMLKDVEVKTTIITSPSSYLNNKEVPSNITIIHTNIFHDRYIIVDDLVYILGTSINSIGKKRFSIIKVESFNKNEILKRVHKHAK